MRHPDERRIALYSGGEAGWIEHLSIGRHLRLCRNCRETAEAYRRDRDEVRRESGDMPADLHWDRLAAEMTANIRVGLEAGECVAAAPARHRVAWRPVFATAGLAMLLFCGWYLNFPAEDRGKLSRNIARVWNRHPAFEPGISLESTRSGIQVSENGSALTLMHPGTDLPVVVVSAPGSLRARYVDGDTGQVTITNVYSQ